MLKKIKEIIYSYRYFLISLLVILCLSCIRLPYYIETTGGLINIEDRIEFIDGHKSSGSFNMTYVSELKGTIPALLVALINNDYDIIKEEDNKGTNETMKQNNYRNRLMLNEANQVATIVAYKLANKEIKISNTDFYVTYIYKEADTDLKIGDQIKKINGNEIKEYSDLNDYINTNRKLDIEVENNNKTYNRTATPFIYGDRQIIGMIITSDYKIDSKINFKFKSSESGPSGGLMMSLAIYNSLNELDLTKGRTIAGTGTISIDGTVGKIDGIKYKLKGAVKNKADIFLVPAENYDEAIKLKEKNNYNIEVVKVNNIIEAIDYLKK